MASPPAVALACRDGGAWRATVAVLAGLAVAVMLAWALSPWAALAGVPVAALVWRTARDSAPHLAWDGVTWTLDGLPGRPLIVLDASVWMLLAFDPDIPGGLGRRRWMALSPAAGPAAWPALRAALYFSASSSPAERPARQAMESRAP